MQKINFNDATLVERAYVTIDGQKHYVTEATYSNGTDLDSNTFNAMQDNIEGAIPTKMSELTNDENYLSYHSQQTGVDLNDFKGIGQYALYGNNANSPFTGICVLEVVVYSGDWILQRITDISQNPTCYVRCFYSGITWGDWKQVF